MHITVLASILVSDASCVRHVVFFDGIDCQVWLDHDSFVWLLQ